MPSPACLPTSTSGTALVAFAASSQCVEAHVEPVHDRRRVLAFRPPGRRECAHQHAILVCVDAEKALEHWWLVPVKQLRRVALEQAPWGGEGPGKQSFEQARSSTDALRTLDEG